MKFPKSIMITIVVFIVVCAAFILSNVGNINQYKTDNVSYTTSIKKINNKEYIKSLNFEYSIIHSKNESFLIYAHRNYLDISLKNIQTTSEVEIKLIDVLGKVVYKNSIRNVQFKKDKVTGLKVGEYKLEVFFNKGSGKGCIEVE